MYTCCTALVCCHVKKIWEKIIDLELISASRASSAQVTALTYSQYQIGLYHLGTHLTPLRRFAAMSNQLDCMGGQSLCVHSYGT